VTDLVVFRCGPAVRRSAQVFPPSPTETQAIRPSCGLTRRELANRFPDNLSASCRLDIFRLNRFSKLRPQNAATFGEPVDAVVSVKQFRFRCCSAHYHTIRFLRITQSFRIDHRATPFQRVLVARPHYASDTLILRFSGRMFYKIVPVLSRLCDDRTRPHPHPRQRSKPAAKIFAQENFSTPRPRKENPTPRKSIASDVFPPSKIFARRFLHPSKIRTRLTTLNNHHSRTGLRPYGLFLARNPYGFATFHLLKQGKTSAKRRPYDPESVRGLLGCELAADLRKPEQFTHQTKRKTRTDKKKETSRW